MEDSINPIIGNISFFNKYGYLPNTNTDDDLRIKTHLEYVENLLRKKDCSKLTLEARAKRNQILDLLYDYHVAGVFPRNYDHNERRPCFIDEEGRICAVGYLVEQTVGREVAERINKKHKYDDLLAMNDESLENWIASSGLTKEEFATIQPSYGDRPRKIKQLVFYYGQSFRLKDSHYNTYDLSYENLNPYRRRNRNSNFKGMGIRLDAFNNAGFSLGLRYFTSFIRMNNDIPIVPYIGFSPVFFNIHNQSGLNLKPETGLRFNIAKTLGFSMNISYSYDIPVISENFFLPGRHDITARLGLSTDLKSIKLYLKKRREAKKLEENNKNKESDKINKEKGF
jgi:hypothetical protein